MTAEDPHTKRACRTACRATSILGVVALFAIWYPPTTRGASLDEESKACQRCHAITDWEINDPVTGRVAHLSIEPESADPGATDGADEHVYIVHLRTEHGTYVKEVLSGEGGKTEPSLTGLLGVRCVCLELDVLAILDESGEAEPVYQTGPPPFGKGI